MTPLRKLFSEFHYGWLRAAPDELVNLFTPESIKLVVTGGETQGQFKMLSGRNESNSLIDVWR